MNSVKENMVSTYIHDPVYPIDGLIHGFRLRELASHASSLSFWRGTRGVLEMRKRISKLWLQQLTLVRNRPIYGLNFC